MQLIIYYVLFYKLDLYPFSQKPSNYFKYVFKLFIIYILIILSRRFFFRVRNLFTQFLFHIFNYIFIRYLNFVQTYINTYKFVSWLRIYSKREFIKYDEINLNKLVSVL